MALSVGSRAPDATLFQKTAEGVQTVQLSGLYGSGKVVLLFFPLAFTSVCTQELCDVSSGLSEYEDLDAQVFGISVDTPFVLEVFAKQNRIGVPLLSDFNREASKAFGVCYESLLGLKEVSKRSAFVIGQNGEILFAQSSDNPKELPDFEALRGTLRGAH